MTRIDADLVIVGGGIVGAALAAELAPSMHVVLVEQEAHLGFHSTGRSAAIFIANYGDDAIRPLSKFSRLTFEASADIFGGELLSPRGAMSFAPPETVEQLRAKMIGRSSETCHHIGARGAIDRVPILRADRVGDAFLDPTAADIDVNRLHAGYIRKARAEGARILMSTRAAHLALEGETWRIGAGEADIHTSQLVNAAGAWADPIAEAIGLAPLGLVAYKRTALLLDPPTGTEISGWPFVIDSDETIYFKPDAGKLLVSPADASPEPAGDAQPEELDIAIAIDRLQHFADIAVRRVNHSWAGQRTYVPDGRPVIGYDSRAPGLFWLAGFGGFGVQTAPAAASIAASLLGEGILPSWASDAGLTETTFGPGRLITDQTGD